MLFSTFVKHLRQSGRPMLAVLIDPDKFNPELVRLSLDCKVACFLVGGSRLEQGNIHATLRSIKRIAPRIPTILFPGDETQLSPQADGLLLLSLLSGRNPDYLIEKHITAAPRIRKMKLPYLSTAYILIGGGRVSSTQKVTGTKALSPSRRSYIVNTALAAEQLGFGAVYLEAGSGAHTSVAPGLIRAAKKQLQIPVIVGGGIDSKSKAHTAVSAGADMVVVGNALEKNVYLLRDISSCF